VNVPGKSHTAVKNRNLEVNQMKRKCLAVGIILLFVGTGIIPAIAQDTKTPSPSTSFGTTIYVDDSNMLGPWDGTLEHPYQHIWQGVNNAHENDTVFVFNGIYYEYNTTEIQKKITIIGEFKEITYVDSFTLLSSGITISGFSIGSIAIFSNDNIIENNIFRYGTNCINFCGEASNNVIKNNIIFETWHGIYFNPETHDNTIEQNLIQNNEIGIYLKGTHQTIQYNIIRDNTEAGIFSESTNSTIFFNVIHSNPLGIEQWSGSQTEIRKNLISKNTQGIDIRKGSKTHIIGNTFRLNECALNLGRTLNFTLVKDNNFYVNNRTIDYEIVCENLLSFFSNYFNARNVIVRNFPRPFVIFIEIPGDFYDIHIPLMSNLIPRFLPYIGFNYFVFRERWSKDILPLDFTQMERYDE
jgi:parallel beta-helix repeat protein